MRIWILLGAVGGLGAVAAGAYGHHSPTIAESGYRDAFMIGVDYQMWHALALLAVGWLAERVQGWGRACAILAGVGFVAGIALFSGSLYTLALTGGVPFAHSAPLGGYLLLVGWAALALAALGRR